MKKEECRCEKMHSFVTSYLHKTGFPNSTQKIHEEVRGACSAAADAGLPIIMSTCDPNCSVGDFNRTALPGSDIDYWTIVYSGDIALKDIVRQQIKSRVSHTMIDLSQPIHVYAIDELAGCAHTPYGDVNDRFYAQGVTNDVWTAQAIQQLVSGTHLYRNSGLTDGLVDSLSNSVLFRTMPAQEKLPVYTKTHVRKRMEYLFSTLSVAEKYALIKLHENKQDGSRFDSSFDGPNAHIFERLKKLGLIEVVETRYGRAFNPLWR